MGIDLLVLDDDQEIIKNVKRIAREEGISCIAYASGIGVINYLKSCADEELPLGYLIDMRIITMDGDSETQNLEGDAPEEIYRILEGKKRTKYFRYFTGHYSPHDEGVEGRTRAIVIVKGQEVEQELRKFFDEIKTTRQGTE